MNSFFLETSAWPTKMLSTGTNNANSLQHSSKMVNQICHSNINKARLMFVRKSREKLASGDNRI
jgi:hypothetical protein